MKCTSRQTIAVICHTQLSEQVFFQVILIDWDIWPILSIRRFSWISLLRLKRTLPKKHAIWVNESSFCIQRPVISDSLDNAEPSRLLRDVL